MVRQFVLMEASHGLLSSKVSIWMFFASFLGSFFMCLPISINLIVISFPFHFFLFVSFHLLVFPSCFCLSVFELLPVCCLLCFILPFPVSLFLFFLPPFCICFVSFFFIYFLLSPFCLCVSLFLSFLVRWLQLPEFQFLIVSSALQKLSPVAVSSSS